jgi:glucose/arabinose dehydrogenase
VTRVSRGGAAVAAAALLLSACGGQPETRPTPTSHSPRSTASPSPTGGEAEAFDPQGVRLSLRNVADGFETPLLVTNAGDGSDRLFVVEQVGRIRVIRDGRPTPEPFLDISSLVTAGGEQGLLGLAFHPAFESNGRFFVNYTDTNGDTVVAEYRAPRGSDRADPGSARVLLRIDQPYSNHNGGDVVFGPDGYLYIGMGDGGSGGDPHGNGQRLNTLLGKLLRIDVDRRRPYGIPEDNPFVDRSGARPEIWAYGLRNPWRFSFDRETDDLWIGDVGQGEQEEIDVARAGRRGGLNYGWNVMEGTQCFASLEDCDSEGLVEPVAVYPTGLGCAVVGGHVYRGARFPALQGGYFFADFCAGVIFALDASRPSRREPTVLLETDHAISSFGEDEQGELYITDLRGGLVLQVTGEPR